MTGLILVKSIISVCLNRATICLKTDPNHLFMRDIQEIALALMIASNLKLILQIINKTYTEYYINQCIRYQCCQSHPRK